MDAVLVPVTLISVMAALVSGAVAWRFARDERRRSGARVVALAAEIAALERGDQPSPRMVAATGPAPDPFDPPLRAPADEGTAHADLFATTQQPPPSHGRLASVVAIGAAIVGMVVMVIYWTNAPTAGAGGRQQVTAASPVDASLELVSLTHSRQGNDWTITGLVQNPAGGAPAEGVAAVAFLFDADGSFVGSGRTPLEVQRLLPGDASPFSIKSTAAGRVERYRISFRAEDGRIVRHVDRRTIRGG